VPYKPVRIKIQLMNRLLFLLLSLLFVQCAGPRRAGFESSYQKALNAYYGSLDERNFDEALKQIDQVLKENPGDLEARTLRAQVYLTKYRFQQDGESRRRLVRDLQSLDRSLRPGRETSDWVPARLYTTTGDWLLLEGNRQLIGLDTLMGQLSAQRRGVAAAGIYTYFRAAHHYFALADSLAFESAAEAPSPGLQKERQYARDGLVNAQQGMMEALYTLDPNNKAPQAQARRQGTLDQLGRLLQGKGLNVQRMPAAGLSFDPARHRAAVIYYDTRNLQLFEDLERRCAETGRDDSKLDSLWNQRILMAEEAGFHHLMEQLLSPRSEVAQAEDDRLIMNLYRELTSPTPCE